MPEFQFKSTHAPYSPSVNTGYSAPIKPAYSPAIKSVAPANPLQEAYGQLGEAEELRLQRKLDRAESICASLIRRYPDYVGALHTLGLILADRGNYERALEYLTRAAMLNPRDWKTYTALSGVYLRLDAPEMAAQVLEQAQRIKPKDSNILVTLGEIYKDEREYELAYDAYREALALEPGLLPAAFGLADTCQDLGRNAEAAELYEEFVKRRPGWFPPVFALSTLPRSVIHIDLLAELDKAVRGKDDDKAEFEASFGFARAAALDKAGRPAEAWNDLVPANRAVFRRMQEERRARRERERDSLARIRSRPVRPKGDANGLPVSLFILGPSRSGKTTMEALVTTLSGVKRGYENPIVENAIRRTFQSAALITSGAVENMPAMLYPLCQEVYAEELGRRAGSAKVLTNTHPGRIHETTQIAHVFSNVRFIFVKRNLEDNVLRIYQRSYTRGNSYSYDLKAAREHVLWYHEMMDVLAAMLPDIVRIIRYEDMVADPAAARRMAAELCGLPVPEGPLPSIGDDRGCAEPYRQFMAPALDG
jgi:tetratricopeptide (TPR) repeat protein